MTEILIIGGGIAGVSAAARLAPHGQVTLVEAETSLGYHASGRSAAAFLEDYGNAVVRALNKASAPTLREADVLKPRGMMLVGRADEAEAHAAEARDFGLEQITVAEARTMIPILSADVVAHAGYRPDIYDLDTDRLLQSFRKAALSHGATFETGHRIDRIARDGAVWRVQAGDAEWRADVVVNAGGAWADEVATLAGIAPIGLTPYRRSIARLPAPGGHDVTDWPFVDGVGEAWYAKPDAGKWLVSPSEEIASAPMDAWPDDMVLAEGLARYEAMVTEPVTRVETAWAGLRTFAPDRALVIGEDPDTPGFFWLAGQGGYGFQTCAAASALVASLVTGTTPDLEAALVASLAPARFR
ncbi:NAD(P)/FAD-dependent oxidoreductase [Pseudaestuariivita atlantica]|uniref:Glycerol-3-phosphate dehydrogenase n=1 Tax=Pseudaestuariivita atlantica TaxID=1317121 RepID=A0A0L1JU32_9RHOB|nr:FAD-dependent oxidoreductase [Pseudaestuariivita atlantica]KNG94913.1 glycerol-3-phosphate dehydrogenase [Pseudaestuariivita atlantica]